MTVRGVGERAVVVMETGWEGAARELGEGAVVVMGMGSVAVMVAGWVVMV